MTDGSKIEWTDATWNPATGCTKVSPGCDHCYAETFAERFRDVPGHHFENGFDVTLRPERLEAPLRWRTPRRIFVNSMSDLFHDAVPNDFIANVFAVMAMASQHTFQVLTKRHGRMCSLLSSSAFWRQVGDHGRRIAIARVHGKYKAAGPMALADGSSAAGYWEAANPLPNVWLGVSVEDQKWADIRVPALLDTPAAVRWLSCEPLLGEVDLTNYLWLVGASTAGPWTDGSNKRRVTDGRGRPLPRGAGGMSISHIPSGDLHWCVIGGESGPGARPMELDWARLLLEQCQETGVAPFVKQLGACWARLPGVGKPDPKGGNWDFWPEDLRVREYPKVAVTPEAVTV